MQRGRRPERFEKVREAKRRARRTLGEPPPTRVADPDAKRRRQAERPKHRLSSRREAPE